MTERGIHCQEVIDYILTLHPVKIGGNFTYLMRVLCDDQNTQTFPKVEDLMRMLKMFMPFFNYQLLREMVQFTAAASNPELLGKMESFEEDIEFFRETVSLATFADDWKPVGKVPQNFTAVIVTCDLNPNEITINGLEALGKKLGINLSSGLNLGLTECAMVFFDFSVQQRSRSLCITWLVPEGIIPHFIGAIKDTEGTFFSECKIEKISIQGMNYYNVNRKEAQKISPAVMRKPSLSGKQFLYVQWN